MSLIGMMLSVEVVSSLAIERRGKKLLQADFWHFQHQLS